MTYFIFCIYASRPHAQLWFFWMLLGVVYMESPRMWESFYIRTMELVCYVRNTRFSHAIICLNTKKAYLFDCLNIVLCGCIDSIGKGVYCPIWLQIIDCTKVVIYATLAMTPLHRCKITPLHVVVRQVSINWLEKGGIAYTAEIVVITCIHFSNAPNITI